MSGGSAEQNHPRQERRFCDDRSENPRDNSNDSNPIWVGGKVYFLSDRNGPVTLFVYDTKSKKVDQVIPNDGLDLKAGSDPQLEKAVQVCLELLAKNPPPKHKKPAYPDYHQKL